MIKINHNVTIRFKLDPETSYEEVIKDFLKEDGFYEMQLWNLLEIYNKLARMIWISPFENGEIIIVE